MIDSSDVDNGISVDIGQLILNEKMKSEYKDNSPMPSFKQSTRDEESPLPHTLHPIAITNEPTPRL